MKAPVPAVCFGEVSLVRRAINPATFGRALTAVARGVPAFFIWYRGWLSATDKAYLIEKGASPANRDHHNYWCFWRRKFSQVMSVVLTIALTVAWLVIGWTSIVFVACVLVMLFGVMGRTKPVITPKDAMRPLKPAVTDELVRKVIASAVKRIKPEDWETVRVLGPIIWDANRVWWTARVELPGTVSGDEVKKVMPALMAGFGVGTSQLDVAIEPTNRRVITLTGTNEDPWGKEPPPSPLETMDCFNIFDPIPLATDAQGRRIFVSLVMTGWLIGAIPRHGKTNLARLLALACALDPYCDLIIFDLKGAADWRMFEPIARRFGLGHSDATIEALKGVLEAVQKEIDRRADVIGGLPLERCPSGHLTRDLAVDPELDLQPIVVFVDEVQWALSHRTHKRKIIELFEGIAKTGQFVGVWLVLATQRPDSLSVPTQVRDVLGTRAALPCMTRQSSETILGTQAYAEGFDAAALPKLPGLAILYGADDEAGLPQSVTARCDLTEGAAATAIVARATAAREALGRLPRQRASQEPMLVQQVRLIQDGRDYVSADEVLEALNKMPENGAAPWNADRLGKAMRSYGHPSFQMNKRTTGDAAMPLELHGRKGYNVLTTREKVATL